MRPYVKNGIDILNKTTKELKNLNGLGIYLSKQTYIDALKVLKLMVLSCETGMVDKKIDVNAINKYTYLIGETARIKHQPSENIIGNLSMNPQNFALEFMEYLSKNYCINYNFECYGTYSILENWLRSFKWMDWADSDMFYKRYDMIDKKMDIIEFLMNNGLISKEQIDSILTTYKYILKENANFTQNQLQRMRYTISLMNHYYSLCSKIDSSTQLSKQSKTEQQLIIDMEFAIYGAPNKDIFNDSKKNAERELEEYIFENDQCTYMIYEIPRLIKEKKVK